MQVSLQPESSQEKKECSVWEWKGVAVDEGDAVADYLSKFLGYSGLLLHSSSCRCPLTVFATRESIGHRNMYNHALSL